MTTHSAGGALKLPRDLNARVDEIESRLADCPSGSSVTLVVFSGELDKLLAAFMIAASAAVSGMRVTMFFTFWGAAALKKAGGQGPGKTLVERMFGWMLPGGLDRRKLSKMDMCGVGRRLMCGQMRKKGVADLQSLIELAEQSGVQMRVCDTSVSLMGIRDDELIDYKGRETCGATAMLEAASGSGITMFI